ncbi:MAG: glycosyl [Actinobacteria bacterium]|nr:MAG: glycosyl [Actinomycetota bacterium]
MNDAATKQCRVLLVVDSLNNGGLERQVSLLARSLHEPWVARVAALGGGIYCEIMQGEGVKVDVLLRRFRFDPSPTLRLRTIVREWAPDVVHTWGWMSTAAALVACRPGAIPVIEGSIRSGRVPPKRGRIQSLLLSRASLVVANSQAGLDAFRVTKARGRVVHNGFDPARMDLCAPDGAKPERFTVAMTGRMSRDKDFRCLLSAARVLNSEAAGAWSFLAVGAGDDRDALMREYADLVSSGVASFLEIGNEPLPKLRGAHVGVLLTDPTVAAEGFSNAIMEYMACGLPVVCTDSGGNRELVLEGETGVLVPPGNVGAVVQALRVLRADTAAASRLGRTGRERILREFSADALARRTIRVYEEAVRNRVKVDE